MARTTLDIATPVLAALKRLSAASGRSLGDVTSELVSEALAARGKTAEPRSKKLHWISQPMKALVDLEDKEQLYRVLDASVLDEVAEP